MSPKRVTFSQQVRAALTASGMTRYRMAKETGLSQGLLSRFMGGYTWLGADSLDRLGALLDLRVVLGPGAAKPEDFTDARKGRRQLRRRTRRT